MKSANYEIAEQVVQLPGFEVDEYLQILNRWHLPLHTAVSYHQVQIVELLVERGAKVDTLCNGKISPMMLACHLVYPTMVVCLLRHGANPNYPSARVGRSETDMMTKLTRELRRERGAAADNLTPQEIGIDRSLSLTAKADYIAQLLLDAGLSFPRKRFLKHSILKTHLSPATTTPTTPETLER